MRSMRAALLALALLGAQALLALETGERLPELRIEKLGELLLEDDTTGYASWDSATLTGKVHVVQYMAARLSAKSLNEPFTDRLKESGLSLDHYHVTTIVNLDDALFGTRRMVLSELRENKKRYFLSSIVADEHGLGREAWNLASGSSAIIILGPDGRVRFFRDGALSAAEVTRALELVRDATEELAAR